MWLKVIIVLLFLLILASLSSGLLFLFKDVGSKSKRTLYALGTRVCLAALMLMCIFYGLYTGQLGSTAPWDAGPDLAKKTLSSQTQLNSESSTQDINKQE